MQRKFNTTTPPSLNFERHWWAPSFWLWERHQAQKKKKKRQGGDKSKAGVKLCAPSPSSHRQCVLMNPGETLHKSTRACSWDPCCCSWWWRWHHSILFFFFFYGDIAFIDLSIPQHSTSPGSGNLLHQIHSGVALDHFLTLVFSVHRIETPGHHFQILSSW